MDRTNRAWTRSRAGLAVAAALTMVACGTAAPQSDESPGTTVAIRSFAFLPTQLTVDRGAEVTWTNGDDILHTVTTGAPGEQGVPGVSDDTPARADGILDHELDGEGATVSFTFEDPGTYPYYCAIHTGMTGVVVVG